MVVYHPLFVPYSLRQTVSQPDMIMENDVIIINGLNSYSITCSTEV